MKKILIAFITIIALATGYKAEAQQGISFNTFYTELSPHGRWVNYPDYGQVWIANARGFEPYANNGHWVFTSYGWTWVSDYSWGWAPFHYGRWTYINSYGWAWIPGYEWAPAWVSWCNYDGYYGWAPLGPGMGFNSGFNSIPMNRWRFVRHQYINNANVYRHYERPVRNVNNVTIINNTQVNNNVTYLAGPQRQEVERLTRKKIETKEIAFTPAAGKTEVDKKQVRLYRPDAAGTQNTMPVEQLKKEELSQPAAVPQKQRDKTVTDLVKPLPAKEGVANPATGSQPVNQNATELQLKREQRVQELRKKETAPLTDAGAQKQAVEQQQAIDQQRLQQQLDLNRQRAEQRVNQPQAVDQQRIERQNTLNRQQAAKQANQQQAAEQQRIQRQNELDRQRAERQQAADEQRLQQQRIQQQNELNRQRQAEQQRQRQQQLQQQRSEQQQIRNQQRVLPQSNPAPQPTQPVRPLKKGKGAL